MGYKPIKKNENIGIKVCDPKLKNPYQITYKIAQVNPKKTSVKPRLEDFEYRRLLVEKYKSFG
ncbi:hypothetical protein KJ603_00245 [Patescibacteria group bacterium]|nr:hypothetical protein [Patescibacteria group bacterium]